MSSVLPGLSTSIRNTWIPQRRAVIIQDMKGQDLFRSDDAPSFNHLGGSVAPGFQVSMSAPGGDIYYTVDGSDPRSAPDPNAGGFSRVLLAENAPKRVLVPTSNALGTTWTGGNEPFNAASWISGTAGVGYDEQSTYNSLINIDIEAEMKQQQHLVLHPHSVHGDRRGSPRRELHAVEGALR